MGRTTTMQGGGGGGGGSSNPAAFMGRVPSRRQPPSPSHGAHVGPDEDIAGVDSLEPGAARYGKAKPSTRDGFDPLGVEHAYAEMESRLRAVIIEMLSPTIQVGRQQESALMSLREQVSELARKINNMFQLPTQVARMQAILDSFREEINKHDAHVHQAVTKSYEDLRLVRTELDGLQRSLEKRDSAIQHLQRDIDRVCMELNRQQDRFHDIEEITKTVGVDSRKEANRAACELEAKIAALQMQHNALTDELWGDEMGLAKVSGQVFKTNETIKQLQEKVDFVEGSMVEASHLDSLRTDVQKLLHKTDTDLFAMKQSVGQAVNETREHLRTALETTAAHNATFVDSVHKRYQEEIAQSSKLRDEVVRFIDKTDASIGEFDDRIEAAAEKTGALLNEQRDIIEEAERRRKRDRSSTDLELKGIKKWMSGIFESSDIITRGFELFSQVVSMMIQAVDMQCALDMQDTLDREHMSLLGVKEEVVPNSVQSSPQKRSPRKGLRRPPVVQVDQRCLSCSGQAASVLSAFKIACLQYCPSPVEYQQQEHTRVDLLQQMRQMLAKAKDVYAKGFMLDAPPAGIDLPISSKNPPDDELQEAGQRAREPFARRSMLGEYGSVVGLVEMPRTDGNSLQLPSLSKPNPGQSPRMSQRLKPEAVR